MHYVCKMSRIVLPLGMLMVLAGQSQAGLIDNWMFNETSGDAANAVSGGPAGTATGVGYNPTGGKIGGAYGFDGSGTVTASGQSNMDFTDGVWSFWIKTPNEGSGNEAFMLMDRRSPNELGSLGAVVMLTGGSYASSSGYIKVQCNSGSGMENVRVNFEGATYVSDDEWHLVTIDFHTASGSTTSLYVDGVLDGSATATADWNWTNGQQAEIGYSHDSWWTSYNGMMDDVAMLDSSLSATQALALYNLGSDSELNYGALDSTALFDVFAGGTGSSGVTSDGKTWEYVTGLSGNAGDVIGHSALILDASGNGVQIVPEPSALVMLICGLFGFVAYAWRKTR